MRIESLRYFLAIMQAGSFSAAARNLFISQQGLSKSVHALEAELGVELFERDGRNARPTEAALGLVPLAQDCLEAEARLHEGMARFSAARAKLDLIELMVMPFVSSSLFGIMKNDLSAAGLRDVVMSEKGLPDILSELAHPSSDEAAGGLAIVCLPNDMVRRTMRDPNLAFAPLIEARIGVAGTEALLSGRKCTISATEVAELPVAYYKEPILDRILGEVFANHPLKRVIMHTSSPQLLEDYVEGGQAITFSDTFSAFADKGSSGLVFVPIRNSTAFTVGFLHSRKRGLSPDAADYVERFAECVRTAYRPYCDRHPFTWNKGEGAHGEGAQASGAHPIVWNAGTS